MAGGIEYLDGLLKGYGEIQDDGTPLPKRTIINVKGLGVVAADNPATAATELTFGSFSAIANVQSNGVPLPQQSTLDFVGFRVTDDIPNAKTLVTAEHVDFLWELSGEYSSALVPGYWTPPRVIRQPLTMVEAYLVRRTGGTSGISRVDLVVRRAAANASRFASSGFQPQVVAGADYATSVKTAFTATGLLAGDLVWPELQEVESYKAGPPEGPEGLTFVLRCRPA